MLALPTMTPAPRMIRWRIPELLKLRGWSAYRLAQETGLTMPAASRLAKGHAVQRIDAATLETLCKAFDLQPGELLEWVPAKAKAKRRR